MEFVIGVVLFVAAWGWRPAVPAERPVDFSADVRPILERRCQPCHFAGGIMYQRRPFDRPETIVALGTKLFTRIKDERERDVIRRFLASKKPAAELRRPATSYRAKRLL